MRDVRGDVLPGEPEVPHESMRAEAGKRGDAVPDMREGVPQVRLAELCIDLRMTSLTLTFNQPYLPVSDMQGSP
jgi:hypothetical protein